MPQRTVLDSGLPRGGDPGLRGPGPGPRPGWFFTPVTHFHRGDPIKIKKIWKNPKKKIYLKNHFWVKITVGYEPCSHKICFFEKKIEKKNFWFFFKIFSDFDRVPPMKNRNRGENPSRPGPRTGDPGPGAPRGPRPVAALHLFWWWTKMHVTYYHLYCVYVT